MIIDTEGLHARAGEFALSSALDTESWDHKRLWAEFESNMASLSAFARRLTENRVQCSQPAEDWLLDHMAFLETQAQEVHRTFPRATLSHLPRPHGSNIPRIVAICEDYLEHVDGRYDVASFENYVNAFQEVSVLSLLECWALPGAMRIVIIRRLAKVMQKVEYRYEVCHWTSSKLSEVALHTVPGAKNHARLNRDLDEGGLSPAQIVHLVQHMNEWDENNQGVRDWLTMQIENSDVSLSQMERYEHQVQAELQVTSGNLVQSLHLLNQMPWQATFKRISHVERILSAGDDSDYAKLDEASQDTLRRRVADLSQQLGVAETLLARTVFRLAQTHSAQPSELPDQSNRVSDDGSDTPPRSACAAYYLMDMNGEIALRKELSKTVRPHHLWRMTVLRHPWIAYLSTGTFVFLAILFLLLWNGLLIPKGATDRLFDWILVIFLLSLPASEWVVNIVHSGITRSLKPGILLRYDFSDGLPLDATTMVVVPVIWSTSEEVDDVMDRLVVHHLANRQENIFFAILADFQDANETSRPDDEALIAHARKRIDEIRETYGPSKFFLFHRERLHNPVDNVHMGWERKRGKLVEFVELLSGKQDTTFAIAEGDLSVLPKVRYVVTVDEDTELPIGVVSRLAGTIHLPFNRPRFNAEGTRVVEGYGVLEPRIAVTFESAQASRFAKLWAGEPGIDPYAFAVSDPYQNLFGSAMFVGKGIFDVQAFRQTLLHRIPNNRVLSHDYLEGGFLRTGLAPDVEIIENHPETYYAHQRRAHRWMRGDWQLITWLWPTVQNRSGQRERTGLPALTRWQIFDSLRRSLVAPALFVIMFLAVTVLPGRLLVWESLVVLTLFLPFLRSVVRLVLERGTLRSVWVSLVQSVMQFVALPFDAALNLDAILRTLYRVFISHKRLLEWVTSAKTNNHNGTRRVFVYEPMGYVFVLLFTVAALVLPYEPGQIVALVLAVVWSAAHPIVAAFGSKEEQQDDDWVEGARPQLQEWARQIWSFYVDYVTEEESWLPPDNVQFRPKMAIAHRTSPTNIGLYLISVLAAKDLGFIDTRVMLRRLADTLESLTALEKWHGHLYNWYDTKTKQPLPPRYVSTVDSGNLIAYLMVLRQGLRDLDVQDDTLRQWRRDLVQTISQLIDGTDFGELYSFDERVFCIGYHVEMDRPETIRYDLLASEARQASFTAIALGKIPASHWFGLGRTMTMAGGHKTLLSWSGTMFEFLMPSLIMQTYPKTVWDETFHGVIARQKAYAKQRHVPFGISESGYYAFDYQLNYQYRAFGVPGLGFERGLEQQLVVAPYAAMLALPFAADTSLDALRQLENLGAKGEYGFYEAIDFTAARLPKGSRYEIIYSFMAHHQGMSFLTLTNLLTDNLMISRFHADKNVRAARLLLQERVPAKAALVKETLGVHAKPPELGGHPDDAEQVFAEMSPQRELNILSNGRMTSLTDQTGGGRLTWNGLSVTRWRLDDVLQTSGVILYIRDVESEAVWTAAPFPGVLTEGQRTVFRLDKTMIEGRHEGIWSSLEVTVAPDLDAEVRRLRLVNETGDVRTLEISSFVELALAPQSADSAHPGFQRLFVQTEHDTEAQCLLARRRPRTEDEREVFAVHAVYLDGVPAGDYEYETDRALFIGRGHSLADPVAMPERLKGTVGAVTDPAFIMHRTVHLLPHGAATVFVLTGMAHSRDEGIDIVHRLREASQVDRQFHLAWMRSQIDLRHLHLSAMQARTAHTLAARFLYPPVLSSDRRKAISNNTLGQSGLWAHGISGDLPIVTVTVNNSVDMRVLTLLARQHQYLWSLGVEAHLVILDESPGGYQDEVMHRIKDALAARGIGEPHLIVGIMASQLSLEERNLLVSVSALWLRADGPSLHAQLASLDTEVKGLAMQLKSASPDQDTSVAGSRSAGNWVSSVGQGGSSGMHRSTAGANLEGEFDNGWGSFVDEGKAYQIFVRRENYLPRPWTNVLANPQFGTIVTELGTGYTWWHNAREFKLTPWRNDAVLDLPSEVLYLRDLDTDDVWSATPSPSGGDRDYKVTHGFGYTTFNGMTGGTMHQMEITVPVADPVKLVQLTLKNKTSRVQRIAVTYYAEWVLDVSGDSEAPYIVSEWDEEGQVLLAHNTYQETFRDAFAFLHLFEPEGRASAVSYTSDRTRFFGGGGIASLAHPAELSEDKLSGRLGTQVSSCGAMQVVVEVPAGQSKRVQVVMGCTDSREAVGQLVTKYGGTRLGSTDDVVVGAEIAAAEAAIIDAPTVDIAPAGTENVEVAAAEVADTNAADAHAEGTAAEVAEVVTRTGATEPEGERSHPYHRAFSEVLSDVNAFWQDVTTQVQVQTPDRSFDILLNGWLLYQTLACRMWARTAFYQAGGAYGFRDQLQDSLALLQADAGLTRQQILRHAAHQYEEGDVQHWWHEETRKGIRTRYSDDLLWLPYAVTRYVEQTGDKTILADVVPFLHSPLLGEEEVERYEATVVSEERAPVYEHCVRAIRHALRLGEHGLPLMGSGDWNDGMNAVGAKGRGESVWLGWFLLDVLKRFADLTESLRDDGSIFDAATQTIDIAVEFESARQGLEEALNREAWDGAWFRRAFTDDGRVIGSMDNTECRIDAIAQSFAVISGGTSRERQLRAMRSFDRELVDRQLDVVKLLTRPFDKTVPSPGYIQGYPPGIRENGGQYTHGAIWSIIAWAMLGERDKAYELFTMLNPITHTLTPHEVMTYGNEPYVMSADVYTAEPHRGRGGWSWYTGAAGWMYQAGLEYILGVKLRENQLSIEPCVPSEWKRFVLEYRFGHTPYVIVVQCQSPHQVTKWVVDGEAFTAATLELQDDAETHQVTCYPHFSS